MPGRVASLFLGGSDFIPSELLSPADVHPPAGAVTTPSQPSLLPPPQRIKHHPQVRRHPLVGLVADLYSRIHRPRKDSAHALPHESFHPNEAVSVLKDRVLVFIPGLLNFHPGDAYFHHLSAPFARGVVLGVAHTNDHIENRSSYVRIGGDERVLQPNWRSEIAVVIDRLDKALTDPSLKVPQGLPLVFVGHSKGGLLTHSLAVLKKIYDKNQGRLPWGLYQMYPGLNQVSAKKLERVMAALEGAQFHLLGTPIEGVPKNIFVQLFDRLALAGSAHYFTPDFLQTHFNQLGVGPEAASTIIFAQRSPSLVAALRNDQQAGGLWGGLVSGVTRTLFHGAAHLVGATEGDGLVAPPSRDYGNVYPLEKPYDHLEMVEKPEAAAEQLGIMAHHAQAQNVGLSDDQFAIWHHALTMAANYDGLAPVTQALNSSPHSFFDKTQQPPHQWLPSVTHKQPRYAEDVTSALNEAPSALHAASLRLLVDASTQLNHTLEWTRHFDSHTGHIEPHVLRLHKRMAPLRSLGASRFMRLARAG